MIALNLYNTITIIVITLTVIMLLVYLFIIKRFNDYLKEHRQKMDSYIYKQANHPDKKMDDTDSENNN